jgi:uncharacterized protein YegP (UPF0339 family)
MAKFELKKAGNGQFMFNLVARNGQIILTSELYNTKAAAMKGIDSVQLNSQMDGRYERKLSADKRHFFVLKAGNHEIIGKSELYDDQDSMESGIASVILNGPVADISDQTG